MKHPRQGTALAYALIIATSLALIAYLFATVLARSGTQEQARVQSADVTALAQEALPTLGEQMIARVQSEADARLAAGAAPRDMRAALAGLCLQGGEVSVRAHFAADSCPGGLDPALRRILGRGGGVSSAYSDFTWPLLLEIALQDGEVAGGVVHRGRLRVRAGNPGAHAYAILARRMEGGIAPGQVFSGPVHVSGGALRGSGHVHFQNTVTSGVQPGFEWSGAANPGPGVPCSGPGCPEFVSGFRAGAGNSGVYPGGATTPASGSPLDLGAISDLSMNGYAGGTELIACGTGAFCDGYRINGTRVDRFSVPVPRPEAAGAYSLPPGSWNQHLLGFNGVVRATGNVTVRALRGPAYSGALHVQSSGALTVDGSLLAVTAACTRPAQVVGGTYLPPACQDSPDILGLSAGSSLVLLGQGTTVQAHLAALSGQVSAVNPTTVTGSVVGDSVAPGNLRITHDPRALNGQAPPAWPLLGNAPWPSVVRLESIPLGE